MSRMFNVGVQGTLPSIEALESYQHTSVEWVRTSGDAIAGERKEVCKDLKSVSTKPRGS